jgi:hypothetical protein
MKIIAWMGLIGSFSILCYEMVQILPVFWVIFVSVVILVGCAMYIWDGDNDATE